MLIAAQVALSVVLLVGAGLLVRTLNKLEGIDVGFDRERLLLFRIDAGPGRPDDQAAGSIHGRIRERIAAIPGVQAATFAWMPLLSRAGANSNVTIPGYSGRPGETPSAMVNAVGPDFFPTIGVSVVLGRGFRESDTAAAMNVTVINETLVKKYFDGQNPVGRHLFYRARPGPLTEVEIVGVVRDTKYTDVRGDFPATLFVPFAQNVWAEATYAVRISADPLAVVPAIRAAVQGVDPRLPLADVRTQEAQIGRLVAGERVFAQFSSCFGGLALVLVGVGLYGLMSYAVTRRTAEIGVRIAVGATARDVLWMVLRESLGLTVVGVVAGAVLAFGVTRTMASLLYEVKVTDPLTYLAVALLLAGAAILAAWLPARRAARVDPVVALRVE